MSDELVPLRWPDGWDEWGLLAGAPFNCILVEGTQAGAPVREGLRVATQPPPEVDVVKGVWPGIRTSHNGRAADAGPTGKPWVDANGWRIEVARAARLNRTIWLDHAPAEGAAVPVAQRVRALAEAEAYGAHWIASPGERDDWKPLSEAARFFSAHREWRTWKPVAWVGLAADFSGPKKELAEEFLNLAARRGLGVRVARLEEAKEFAAVVTIGVQGSGNNVIAGDGYDDPYQLVQDAHLEIGREHDLIRLYNGGSINMYYAADGDRKRGVIHLIHYAASAGAITVATKAKWRSATIHTLPGGKTTQVKPQPVRYGAEIPIPDFGVYAAVELEA